METLEESIRITSISAELYLSSVDLAAVLKLSDSEVAKLARSGVLVRRPHPNDSRAFVYPVWQNVTRFVEHSGKRKERAAISFVEEKAKTQKAQRARTELKHAIESGRMVDKDKLFLRLEPIILAYKGAVLARADRLETKLARVKDRKARVALIRADSSDLLSMLGELLQTPIFQDNGASAQKEGT